MRFRVALLALMLLSQSGCTVVFPIVGIGHPTPTPGTPYDAAQVQPGTRVLLVTRKGEAHVGRWRGLRDARRDSARAFSLHEQNGTILRLPEAEVRGVYAPVYPRPNWKRVGHLFVAGVLVDAAWVSSLVYVATHQCRCPDYDY